MKKSRENQKKNAEKHFENNQKISNSKKTLKFLIH